MAKRLTDALVLRLAAPKHGPKVVWDTLATGFGVKVTPKGKRLFVLQTRYPGHSVQTTRTIGRYPAISLAGARAKAEKWYGLAKTGIDPAIDEAKTAERERRAAMLAQERSFGSVAEAYFARGLTGQRWGHRVRRQIERELIPHWGNRPIAEITRLDVVALIEAIMARPARAYAANVFQAIRAVFNWALERNFGLENSPCDRIRISKLIGEKQVRTRVLSDEELQKLWAATGKLADPYGPLVRMLMLTGCRVNEAAGARWREFDLTNRLWVIPAERFKSNAQHAVPLCDDMLALLDGLPPGDFLFSTTKGKRPINGLSKAKARIDAMMGDVPPWVFHDIRRTVRTRLSALRVPEPIAEAVIGHARKGLARIYDQHEFADEIREALDAWAAKLRTIVGAVPARPGAENVVALQSKRRSR